ncbi:hypothetical protein [uncultured Phycicoccus sp.]|uniref:hypothetical protein n=1 Tax=uncultured Phycicoccus sp. TaxID=661422 RepID=UPI0026190DA8|nr:hypothetical protein [uncultured Phycicoccus sp.]
MPIRTRSTSVARAAGAIVVTASFVAAASAPALGAPDRAGFLTGEDPYITLAPGVPKGASVTPIISSGDTLGAFEFQGLPDGIGVRSGEAPHTVEVYVAHEQTTVPFRGTADFEDASVAKLTLSTVGGKGRGGVLAAEVALGPEVGFLRFCSAEMVGPAEGFDTDVFVTGEETDDAGLAVPAGAPYGPDPFPGDGTRQGGYAVVLDTATGESTSVAGMGRLNHENTIALPGYDEIAMLTTDDTFNRPSAQVYLYRAADQAGVFADDGHLWAFRVTGKNGAPVDPADPFNGANDYGDVRPGDDLTGEFIPVPDDIARGQTGALPQAALESWSNAHNVFQFVRAEDIAYDKNDPHVVYMADTGGGGVVPDPATGRLARGPGAGVSPNGAVFRFEFDHDDPTVVTSFGKLAQGDDPGAGAYVPFVSPDNLDTSRNSLMVQEDADDAKVWQHRLRQGTWAPVATVNDPDGESSGIVDVSAWFGGGTWLLDVQGHGRNVRESLQDGVLRKLESGQLMLLKVPGS